ncbi:hypothetical protein [Streptomyces sp. CB03238]|uniref:hypothetical protein n=1 Tax=Streptomyces sp. CB03238 TaxID=1907777 RepID=UPI000A111866|nr:hypothetical protein [Streptomyces sp. CB03238]ORT59545.1 hypothetical protein BKD26_11550 [Streptomyces sp. CB03238]
MSPEGTVTGVAVPQEDVDAIVAFVAGVQHAQQNALPDTFMSGFRQEAFWTTAHGKRLTVDPASLVAGNSVAVSGTPLYVLAEDDGVWRVAAAQNTKVIDPETLAAG